MSKLRDLLDKRKAAENAASTSPQSKQQTPAPQKVEPIKRPSILDKFKKPAGIAGQANPQSSVPVVEQSGEVNNNASLDREQSNSKSAISEKIISSDGEKQSNNVSTNAASNEPVSGSKAATQVTASATTPQTLAPKLSLLQRKLQERQNAVVNTPSPAINVTVQNTGNKEQTQTRPATVEEIPQLSASQSADAQKQNQGSVHLEELKSNLKYLSDNIENKDLVAQVVRTIAVQVGQHPEIGKHMTRGEKNLMVRGLRMAYQVAAMKKQEKATTKKAADKDVDQLSAMMKDMGFSMKF